ncbi:AbrB/MazE/SpoVT family DNA-binding domain-containing protein [Pantoea deleyi]|uniref:AbrB/MazE/SpoVT family DNA-binding domain-containing protein n=1 Tax=Pantoea deleyi TaxID=470932 RepID=UPI0035D522A3
MSIVSIFRKGNHRAIRLPRDLDFEGVSILAIIRGGDSFILHPVRPTRTLLKFERAEPVFRTVREDVVIKDDPTCEKRLDVRHMYQFVHHARAA